MRRRPQLPIATLHLYKNAGRWVPLPSCWSTFIGESGGVDGFISISRGIGLYLGAIAAVVAAAGGLLKFKESGGDLNDLKDIDKLKSSFNQGGGSTPPSVG